MVDGEPRFELYRGAGNRFHFRLVTADGTYVLESVRGYATERAARWAIAAVKLGASRPARYRSEQIAQGGSYFVVVDAAGEEVAHSAPYASPAEREAGVALARRLSGDAYVWPPRDKRAGAWRLGYRVN